MQSQKDVAKELRHGKTTNFEKNRHKILESDHLCVRVTGWGGAHRTGDLVNQ